MSAQEKYLLVHTISTGFTHDLVTYAAKVATEAGKPTVISIVDRDGNLKAFLRMDGAPLLSIEISQDKAYTAAAFGLPTDQWFNFIKDDEPLRLGVVHTNRLVTFDGGCPIVVNGAVVGRHWRQRRPLQRRHGSRKRRPESWKDPPDPARRHPPSSRHTPLSTIAERCLTITFGKFRRRRFYCATDPALSTGRSSE